MNKEISVLNGLKVNRLFILSHLFFFCIFGFSIQKAFAQDSFLDDMPDNSKKSKANAIWNFDVLGSVDFPAADMAKRFGTSYKIGGGIRYKSNQNWFFGAKFEFITGNKTREDSLLWNIKTKNGIISMNGELMNVGIFERGYTTGIQVGKLFSFWQANNYSGPMMIGSVGFMQYRINLFDRDNSFPHLNGDYKKGYDRLTNGVYIEDFIGYQYFSKSKLINFYAGFNFLWGFTQVRRDYTFDLGRKESESRNDILAGFKLGWVVPIYKKKAEETYY
ncbi:MAG TPA: hypothetical protein PKA54_01920 [Chitinophagaceae bacterium]|mgnify:CR=1 FL=1|nr:hypothetical protein [Chitinophagaceae bacterium]